jgi:hypothetical protein
MLEHMPEELLIAYQQFTLLATHYGFAYAGFMMRANPVMLIGIGNVTEKGTELAKLLRDYADMLDKKAAEGMEIKAPLSKPS